MNDLEQYVQKYAAQHGISVEEAKKHAIVKEVEKHYKSNDNNNYKWW